MFLVTGVVIGPKAHRRWSDEMKARIVAEPLADGVSPFVMIYNHDVSISDITASML